MANRKEQHLSLLHRWSRTRSLCSAAISKVCMEAGLPISPTARGQSYAIPTMQGGVETIRPYVDEFIWFAKQHPELTFLVTRIGCGIAGFTDDEISPLFEKAHEVENIVLPPSW